jgi:4-amino-4-deoxy-L-arabinose transferase-like glycosyltransferase
MSVLPPARKKSPVPAEALPAPPVKPKVLVRRGAIRATWSALTPKHFPSNQWLCRPSVTVLLLIGLCGFFFFYGINHGELYRTESLRAIIAAEFLRTGNWVVPTLYGEPLFTKPPGMYIAIALASWPMGHVSEWTSRLPSALAATFTVFLFYGFFRRRLGNLAGLAAAVLLPLSFMWLDKATAAEIDMLQVAWVTAALFCFDRALEITEASSLPPPHSPLLTPHSAVWFWWLAALLAVTGGVLTKWTAPAFFYGTVVPLLWWRRRLRLLWQGPHVVGAAVGVGLCLAWAWLAITRGGWDAFVSTVSREALMHLSPGHHHRSYPWLESLVHPLRVLAASLPVSAFALVSLWPGFARCWDERGRRLLQLLHCWTWPNLLFWSAVPEHGTRQSFPLFPGLAGLAALVWVAWLTGRWPWRWPRVAPGGVLVGFVCAWIVVKLVFVHGVVPARDRKREPRHKASLVAARVPPEEILYLFRLKDEGIMFYYGRTVRRLHRPEQLPSSPRPAYCILDEVEWREMTQAMEVLLHLQDEQGAPIVLVRM